MRLSLLPIALLAAAALAGCGSGSGGQGALTVVATTTQAADFARAVAGPRADVHSILSPNTDPHEYEVRPRDVKALTTAALVVRSGGELDRWLSGAIDSSGTHAPVLTLSDHVALRGDDPHW